MFELDFDPASLREWIAAVGMVKLLSATTDSGRMRWLLAGGRYRLEILHAPNDLADRCASWVRRHRSAWSFGDKDNVNFDAVVWRQHALRADAIEAALWCAVASDAVLHRSGDKLQGSGLEYAQGGGHQDWLASMRDFLAGAVSEGDFARILSGQRNEAMKGKICRWDPACERSHAYRSKALTKETMTQDQTINALAAIGFASLPSAPASKGLSTPLVAQWSVIRWPVWTEPLRSADLEARLYCGWDWPTMEARRWWSGKLICFSRGEFREPEVSSDLTVGSRKQKAFRK